MGWNWISEPKNVNGNLLDEVEPKKGRILEQECDTTVVALERH